MTRFDDFLKEQLNDPELKAEYDALEPEFHRLQAQLENQRQRISLEPADRTGGIYAAKV